MKRFTVWFEQIQTVTKRAREQCAGATFEQNAHCAGRLGTALEFGDPTSVTPLANAFVADRPKTAISRGEKALKVIAQFGAFNMPGHDPSVVKSGRLAAANDPRPSIGLSGQGRFANGRSG